MESKLIITLVSFFTVIRGSSGHYQSCERITTYNYHYTPTFDMTEMDAGGDAPGIVFNFSVRAVSDGHLKLSATPDPKQSLVTLEIIIGAGANTFSAVRRRPKKTVSDFTVNTNRILSDKEMRHFSLTLTSDFMELYSNTSNTIVFHYEDSSISDMRYIAFGAWNNIGVEWSFNCKNAQMAEPAINDSLYRLKYDYWAHYDPFNPPVLDNNTLTIDVTLAISYINLNVKDALFEMRANFELKWKDQKLQWSPKEYGNITNMTFKHRVIWMPDLVLLNSPKSNNMVLSDTSVTLDCSGVARWKSQGNIATWCGDDVSAWPADVHVCEVHIGLHSNPNNVWVNLSNSDGLPKTLEPGLEWEIVSIVSEEAKILDPEFQDDEGGAQSFTVIIKIRRINSPYVLLFIVPLSVLYLVLMSTFIIEPCYSSRLTLVSTAVVVLYILLLLEENELPALPRNTPRIIKTTSSLFILAIIQLLFHGFNVHIAAFNFPAPKFVRNSLKRPWMKYLHKATYQSYVQNENQFNNVTEEANSIVTAKWKDAPESHFTNKYHWTLLSRALDAIIFLLLFLIVPSIVLSD